MGRDAGGEFEAGLRSDSPRLRYLQCEARGGAGSSATWADSAGTSQSCRVHGHQSSPAPPWRMTRTEAQSPGRGPVGLALRLGWAGLALWARPRQAGAIVPACFGHPGGTVAAGAAWPGAGSRSFCPQPPDEPLGAASCASPVPSSAPAQAESETRMWLMPDVKRADDPGLPWCPEAPNAPSASRRLRGEGQAWGSAPRRLTVGLSGPVFIFSGPGLMRSL